MHLKSTSTIKPNDEVRASQSYRNAIVKAASEGIDSNTLRNIAVTFNINPVTVKLDIDEARAKAKRQSKQLSKIR